MGSSTPELNTLYSDNIVKAFLEVQTISGVPGIASSFNVASISDDAPGQFTVTWQKSFATARYSLAGLASATTDEGYVTRRCTTAETCQTATSVQLNVVEDTGSLTDQALWSIIAVGVQ